MGFPMPCPLLYSRIMPKMNILYAFTLFVYAMIILILQINGLIGSINDQISADYEGDTTGKYKIS